MCVDNAIWAQLCEFCRAGGSAYEFAVERGFGYCHDDGTILVPGWFAQNRDYRAPIKEPQWFPGATSAEEAAQWVAQQMGRDYTCRGFTVTTWRVVLWVARDGYPWMERVELSHHYFEQELLVPPCKTWRKGQPHEWVPLRSWEECYGDTVELHEELSCRHGCGWVRHECEGVVLEYRHDRSLTDYTLPPGMSMKDVPIVH